MICTWSATIIYSLSSCWNFGRDSKSRIGGKRGKTVRENHKITSNKNSQKN